MAPQFKVFKATVLILSLGLSVLRAEQACENNSSIQPAPLPISVTPLVDGTPLSAMRAKFSPYHIREALRSIKQLPFAVEVDNATDDEAPLVEPIAPEQLRAMFLQRLLLVSGLDESSDLSGRKSAWFERFRDWMIARDIDILAPANLSDHLKSGTTIGALYGQLRDQFEELDRYRLRTGLDARVDKVRSRTLRSVLGLKRSAHKLAQRYYKWTPLAILGLAVYFVGVDLIRTNVTNELKYQMIEGRTDLATEVQLTLNQHSFEERKALFDEFPGDVRMVRSETARVLASVSGLSPAEANHALFKMEEDFAHYHWATERFLSKTMLQGRSEWAGQQMEFPSRWMLKINASYGNFLQLRESRDRYKLDLERHLLEVATERYEGENSNLAEAYAARLRAKIDSLEPEIEFYRKQVASILATWKIYELVYDEYLVREDGNPYRAALYTKIVQELGFKFYLEQFQQQFEIEAKEMGFAFKTGKITAAMAAKIQFNYTGPAESK